MMCPEHKTPLREEWGSSRTGFCLTCTKHWPLCCAVRHMGLCIQVEGHGGFHKDAQGNLWSSDSVGRRPS